MKTDYEEARITLSKSFQNFLKDALRFSQKYTDAAKFKHFTGMWLHPKGIANLVKTISLQNWCTAEKTEQDLEVKLYPLTNVSIKIEPFPQKYENVEVKRLSSKIKEENSNSMKKQTQQVIKQQEKRQEIYEACEEDQEDQSDDDGAQGKSYKRGPYKSYSIEEKLRAVDLFVNKNISVTEISRMLKIPCKNIKRWSTEGINRKRGGGRRRTSPEMEQQTYRWIIRNFSLNDTIQLEQIQQYALNQSNDPNFKASRGWVLKFVDRFHLRDQFELI